MCVVRSDWSGFRISFCQFGKFDIAIARKEEQKMQCRVCVGPKYALELDRTGTPNTSHPIRGGPGLGVCMCNQFRSFGFQKPQSQAVSVIKISKMEIKSRIFGTRESNQPPSFRRANAMQVMKRKQCRRQHQLVMMIDRSQRARTQEMEIKEKGTDR